MLRLRRRRPYRSADNSPQVFAIQGWPLFQGNNDARPQWAARLLVRLRGGHCFVAMKAGMAYIRDLKLGHIGHNFGNYSRSTVAAGSSLPSFTTNYENAVASSSCSAMSTSSNWSAPSSSKFPSKATRHMSSPAPAISPSGVSDYSRTARDDIRRNRMNSAERLGFIGRVMHGRKPRTWLRELRAKIGEPVDYSLLVAMETA